ncbi:MAG: isoprenylcysteine carboxylmethyltransferase family protein, partial [Terriglobales bacterium]
MASITWATIAHRIRIPLGFGFTALYLWLATPTELSVLIGSALIVPGLVVRALASGHVQKNEQLTTTGPYAYTRNPLYLGSLILAVGFAISARNLWIGAGLIVIFLAVYLPVIRGEEAYLREHFAEFAEYARQVPRLWPRSSSFSNNHGKFSWDLYWKHREYNATLG